MKQKFLQHVLGDLGYTALGKAMQASNDAEGVVFARTLLSWLDIVSRTGFDGPTPGTDIHLTLNKSNTGLTGIVHIENTPFTFEDKNTDYVAALLAVALGADSTIDYQDTKGIDKLGKSIDSLVKAEFVNKNFQKSQPRFTSHKLPGKPAAPLAPLPPTPPTKVQSEATAEAQGETPDKAPSASTKKAEKKPATKKPFWLKMKKHELSARCDTCDQKLFNDDKFVGCYCHDPAGITLVKNDLGISLKFDTTIDPDDILVLIEGIKNVQG
jgi:hypothetical protein